MIVKVSEKYDLIDWHSAVLIAKRTYEYLPALMWVKAG